MELITGAGATTLLANVATGIQDTGTALFPIVAVAVAIPLTFWVLHAIKGLFPSSRARKA